VRGLPRQEGLRLPSHALMSVIGWQRLLQQGFEQEHLLVIVAAYFETFQKLTQSIKELERELAEREKQDARGANLWPPRAWGMASWARPLAECGPDELGRAGSGDQKAGCGFARATLTISSIAPYRMGETISPCQICPVLQ
jgi:hypothetical protein